MSTNETELVKNGTGVGIGLIIMFFAAENYHWYGFMKAHPSVGEIYTTGGFTLFYFGLFGIGTIIAYTFFMRGFASVSETATTE
jgi:hypothetical protein